jgi:(S)-3,5-dihydroxyphenylglycine transaminase
MSLRQQRVDAWFLAKESLHASLADPVLDTMTFLNEVTLQYPAAISFAPGRPYEGFFETAELAGYLARYLRHLEESGLGPEQQRTALFQYGPTAGQIRELVTTHLLLDEGIDVARESVVVTVGCQEAMLIVLRALFAEPPDVLLVASPCYVGITGAARLLDVDIVPVPERGDGLAADDVARMAEELRSQGRRPRACYVVPDFSNPSGSTMSLAARHSLLAVAEAEDLLILEDSPYRAFAAGERLPTLKSLDRRLRVVHLGSFAKSAFPGARVGFVVADQLVRDATGRTGLLADELAKIKSMVTVNTSPISQALVAGMILEHGGRLHEASRRAATHCAANMRRVLGALEEHFPRARREALRVGWKRPDGGFFLTLWAPFPLGEAALRRSARDYGVIWTPMRYFHCDGGGERAMRLACSYLSGQEAEEGVARLARFLSDSAADQAQG